jgi:hypothetical protein
MKKKCPTCHRAYKGKNHALVGNNHGDTAKEAAKSLGDTSKLARDILDYLRGVQHIALTKSHRANSQTTDSPEWDGWVSRDTLSRIIAGGDGARRARELRECGYPVESKMMSVEGFPYQAWYRLNDNELEIQNEESNLLAQREYEQYLQEGLS